LATGNNKVDEKGVDEVDAVIGGAMGEMMTDGAKRKALN
jgi:hypothetical protein